MARALLRAFITKTGLKGIVLEVSDLYVRKEEWLVSTHPG